jgi:integrase/recombinase XerD
MSSDDLMDIEPYAGFLAICKSEHTRDNYLQDLRLLRSFLQESGLQGPEKVQPADLTRFAGILAKPGRTPNGKPRPAYSTRTMKRILASTRSFYRFLAATQRISTDPTAVFHYLSVRTPQRNPRPLSGADRMALLGSLKAASPEDVRISLLVRLGFECGLRVSEAANLKRQDVDLVGLSVTVLGKGDKERQIPITEAAKALFRDLFAHHDRDDELKTSPYVFSSPRDHRRPIDPRILERWVKTAADWAHLAGAGEMTVHVLRHTFGTCLAESGASVYEIRDLMGHSSITVSENYVKIASNHARETHRKAFRKYALRLGPDDFAPGTLRRFRLFARREAQNA